MILTTMCYIQKDHQTLMLHRIKKENDINGGKWIGVGGKFEEGESAEECMRREIYEETGLTALKLQLHGFVVFPQLYHGQDEGMFVYTCWILVVKFMNVMKVFYNGLTMIRFHLYLCGKVIIISLNGFKIQNFIVQRLFMKMIS